MTAKNREIIRLALTEGAKAKLDDVAGSRDMKLIGVVSRLVEWFVEQDRTLQSVILGLVDEEDTASVLDLIQKRLGEGGHARPMASPGGKPNIGEVFVEELEKVRQKKKGRGSRSAG